MKTIEAIYEEFKRIHDEEERLRAEKKNIPLELAELENKISDELLSYEHYKKLKIRKNYLETRFTRVNGLLFECIYRRQNLSNERMMIESSKNLKLKRGKS